MQKLSPRKRWEGGPISLGPFAIFCASASGKMLGKEVKPAKQYNSSLIQVPLIIADGGQAGGKTSSVDSYMTNRCLYWAVKYCLSLQRRVISHYPCNVGGHDQFGCRVWAVQWADMSLKAE